MQTVTLQFEDNMIDKIMWLLSNFKDIKLLNTTNGDLNDIQLFEEAKKDTDNIKSVDDMLKEYNIES